MTGEQLGKITELVVTPEQQATLMKCTTGKGGNQSLCKRVYDSIEPRDGVLIAKVSQQDMERINTAVNRPDRGTWQDVFRGIMKNNS